MSFWKFDENFCVKHGTSFFLLYLKIDMFIFMHFQGNCLFIHVSHVEWLGNNNLPYCKSHVICFFKCENREKYLNIMTGQASDWWHVQIGSLHQLNVYWSEFNCVVLNCLLNYQNNLISTNPFSDHIDQHYIQHLHPDTISSCSEGGIEREGWN